MTVPQVPEPIKEMVDTLHDPTIPVGEWVKRRNVLLAALLPTPKECLVNEFSSRGCELGTKGCDVVHFEVRPTLPGEPTKEGPSKVERCETCGGPFLRCECCTTAERKVVRGEPTT